LDLDNCSAEEKKLINDILKLNIPEKVAEAPKPVTSDAVTVPITDFDPTLVPQQEQQQQQQPFHPPPPPFENPPVSDYPSSMPPNSNHSFTSYSTAATPCVFINNVTANVNVLHGPSSHHLQEDQHLPPNQPQLMPQRFHAQAPPPISGFSVAPQPNMLPNPQFASQLPPQPNAFVPPPFGHNPAAMGMAKPALYTHYPHHVMGPYYMAPFPYGYPQMIAPNGIPQVRPLALISSAIDD